ncbi:signal peptidase I [Gemmiger sp. An87]|nr:signal peptidase I [Gemmiger sp. An87]
MVKKVCNLLSTIILIVLLAASVVIFVPMLLGYKEMVVLSGSMEPAIPVGSLIYVKPVEAAELAVGDVCTYRLPDGETFVTHRVVSIDADAQTMVTQGDANEDPDLDIQFSQVYGRASFHLPYLGFVTQNIRTSVGIMTICGIVMLVILLNFVPAILDAADEEKKQKSEQAQTIK